MKTNNSLSDSPRNFQGNSPKNNQIGSNGNFQGTSPRESSVIFLNIPTNSQQNINGKRRSLTYFNGIGFNVNFKSPRTYQACIELGILPESFQEQLNSLKNELYKPPKNELPEITQLKMDHYNKRIKGKSSYIIKVE